MKKKKSKKKLSKSRRKQLHQHNNGKATLPLHLPASASTTSESRSHDHRQPMMINGTHGQRGDDESETKPPPIVSGSRKRLRRNVEFVLPKDSSNERKPYVFDKQRRANEQSEATTKESRDNPENGNKTSQKAMAMESIDDILFAQRKKGHGRASATSETGVEKPSSEEANGAAYHKEGGRLSGLSVEDAVRDKAGCRPRANSTDGELNLPCRGLCDERMVLEAHKWKGSVGHTPPRGFMNLGNTCFLNATLQCLAYLPTFSQTLMSLPIQGHDRKPSKGQRIALMLKTLFQKVHGMNGVMTAAGDSIAPHGIVRAVPTLGSGGRRCGYTFRPGQQEDAHEFLVHLLDAMQDGELKAAGIDQHASGWRDRLPIPRLDETTWINRIFGGYLRSQVRCTKCGYRSNTYDPFLDLSLEVSRKSSNSVASAFTEFTRKETLDSRNQWKCSGCKNHVCATKQLTVFRPPLSLCIQLKRFTYGGSSFGNFGFGHYGGKGIGMMMGRGGSKITKPIEFPAELKLPLSDGRKCEYHLTGVVVHIGGSASSGHYTAFVKKPGSSENYRWYHMDDSYIEPVSEKTVLKQKNAYVLFYCRKEVKIEYPAPPPRAFMSADEARESGIVRARARANSLDNASKGDAAPFAMASSTSDDHAEAARILKPGIGRARSPKLKVDHVGKRNADEGTNVGTPSSNHEGSKSAIEPSSSSSDDDSQSSSRSDKYESTVPLRLYTVEQYKERKTEEARKERDAPASSCSSSSSATSDSDSESDDDSTSSDSASSEDPVDNQDYETRREDCLKPSRVDASKSHSKTCAVADHGGARGKLQVMLGPRQGTKAWKPKADGATARNSEHELLGSVKVGKWDDDIEEEAKDDIVLARTAQNNQRKNALTQLEKQDRSKKRKMHLDRWDAMLDEGKTKKVKLKQEGIPLVAHEPKANPFHRIQSGMQRMNRGRSKGWRWQSSHKYSPRGRGGKNNRR